MNAFQMNILQFNTMKTEHCSHNIDTPDVSHGIDYLMSINPHPRDKRIKFDEGPHVYTIDEGTGSGMDGVAFTSVTTWNHSHFEHFDADKIIDGMMKSKKWNDPVLNAKYYGKTRDEIKAMWDANRDMAAGAGTGMHYNIECFYNKCLVGEDWDRACNDIEFQYFLRFNQDWCGGWGEEVNSCVDGYGLERPFINGYGQGLLRPFINGQGLLRPFRTEWTVFHEEARLSGSIDMVYENIDPATGEADGTLSIYDWKRCKEIVKTNAFGKCAITPEISHLPDTNFWHYCLQLNTYKAILEMKYGKVVTDLYLVCLHPDNKNGNYLRIKVADLQEEVRELISKRAAGFLQEPMI